MVPTAFDHRQVVSDGVAVAAGVVSRIGAGDTCHALAADQTGSTLEMPMVEPVPEQTETASADGNDDNESKPNDKE